jgi:hypothetical protein
MAVVRGPSLFGTMRTSSAAHLGAERTADAAVGAGRDLLAGLKADRNQRFLDNFAVGVRLALERRTSCLLGFKERTVLARETF